jgi:hypothetical protein
LDFLTKVGGILLNRKLQVEKTLKKTLKKALNAGSMKGRVEAGVVT